ncbi:MAG TPA: LacI family DNA-binding transcriptional regulator [Lacunisphaera sp.]|nr:LacI family DNA-binding transcriptional regulator [Lacunisphaera sp.]
MNERITQSDIARVAGVHNTTVSLALRNSPLIPQGTRERIQAVAQSLGYAPDPALRALAAYRNSRRVRRQVQTLAYVTDAETKWGWKLVPSLERQYAAVQRRATALGYRLEHLWFGDAGMSPRRLDRMMLHRGIRGVLLALQGTAGDDLSAISWARLTAVKIGCVPSTPALNQVSVDPAGVVRLALRQILAEGGRRPGLVLPRRRDELSDQAWSAAFHAELYRGSIKERVPVLFLEDSLSGPSLAGDASALLRWYQQHRPDVIVGLGAAVPGHIRQCGLRTPWDVAYVDLNLQERDGALAGVWENCEKLGELAVEMLVSQLEQNVTGLPAVPTVTSIGGVWQDGASLPPRMHPVEDTELAVPQTFSRNLVA